MIQNPLVYLTEEDMDRHFKFIIKSLRQIVDSPGMRTCDEEKVARR